MLDYQTGALSLVLAVMMTPVTVGLLSMSHCSPAAARANPDIPSLAGPSERHADTATVLLLLLAGWAIIGWASLSALSGLALRLTEIVTGLTILGGSVLAWLMATVDRPPLATLRREIARTAQDRHDTSAVVRLRKAITADTEAIAVRVRARDLPETAAFDPAAALIVLVSLRIDLLILRRVDAAEIRIEGPGADGNAVRLSLSLRTTFALLPAITDWRRREGLALQIHPDARGIARDWCVDLERTAAAPSGHDRLAAARRQAGASD